MPLAPPPIIGLGTGGGFTYVLQDLRGGDPKALAQVVRGLTIAANEEPQLSAASSRTFSATNPSIYLDIDRNKVQILGVSCTPCSRRCRLPSAATTSTTSTCSAAPGRSRSRPRRSTARASTTSIASTCATPSGKMVPLRSLLEVRVDRRAAGADPLQQSARRHRAGRSGAGRLVRARRSRRWRRSPRETLPAGYAGDWTDTAFQEKRAEGKTRIILAFAVLFAFLFLVALYESWTIPVPVLLSVSVGILGAFAAIVLARSDPRSLRPDRHDRADRPCGEERHPHRRVRQGAARDGASPCTRRRRRARGCASGR